MVQTRRNTKHFHRILYWGWYQTVTLLKRNDDQQQGVVTAYTLRRVWGKRIRHTGEAIAGGMAARDTRGWLIPRSELDLVGVDYRHINALDRIIDEDGHYWQPEAPDTITLQMGGNYIDLMSERVDPNTAVETGLTFGQC